MTEHKGRADYFKKLDDETVKKINKLLESTGWTVGDIFRARHWECYDLDTDIKIAEIAVERSRDVDKWKEVISSARARKNALLQEGIYNDVSEWF